MSAKDKGHTPNSVKVIILLSKRSCVSKTTEGIKSTQNYMTQNKRLSATSSIKAKSETYKTLTGCI